MTRTPSSESPAALAPVVLLVAGALVGAAAALDRFPRGSAIVHLAVAAIAGISAWLAWEGRFALAGVAGLAAGVTMVVGAGPLTAGLLVVAGAAGALVLATRAGAAAKGRAGLDARGPPLTPGP